MAINIYIKHNLITRITNKASKFCQALSRSFTHESPYVYFRYRSSHIHPVFSRFYDNPPLKWTTKKNAKLLHWISYPDFVDDRPFIIEPNDHPLSVHGWKNTPSDSSLNLEKLISDSKEVYEHASCKAVILTSEDNINMFKTYMPEKLWSKIVQLPYDTGALPRKYDESIRKKTSKVKFLCLASDFDRKGLILILNAWNSLEKTGNAFLTIVCPKIPKKLNKFDLDNVRLIEEGPISEKFKKELYVSHHVALCPTLIDGGANIIEAMEYGLAIITSDYHRSECFMKYNVGFSTNSPYKYYDVEHYGKTWHSVNEYIKIVNNAINNGEYQLVIDEWKGYLLKYINDNTLSYSHGKNSYTAASFELSNKTRNKLLKELYIKTNND
jgi:glycosyltransferase involved in cell wall biosynthesis